MSLKRPSDVLVAVQDVKRSRSELAEITNRDKALVEAVSSSLSLKENVFVYYDYV